MEATKVDIKGKEGIIKGIEQKKGGSTVLGRRLEVLYSNQKQIWIKQKAKAIKQWIDRDSTIVSERMLNSKGKRFHVKQWK